jgi:cytochrome c oxidase subunit II
MSKIPDTIHRFFYAMSRSASPNEDEINKLFLWFLFLAAVILIIVISGVLIGVIRYRRRQSQGEPEQITGIKWLEITWTILPFCILSFFFYFTVKFMKEIGPPVKTTAKPDVIIIAHQWWWELQYPEYNFTTANELHIPVNKNLLMKVESADVIHDWWVPALGRKIDAIPGRDNFMWIEAAVPGEYQGACSEYCGTQHAGMRILVFAELPADYDKWVKEQQSVPAQPADSVAQKGLRIFREKACASCHAIAGTNATSHIGPDLTHLSGRKTLISDGLPNTPANLLKWLQDPQKLKNGAHMPNFILSSDDLDALVKYLEELK